MSVTELQNWIAGKVAEVAGYVDSVADKTASMELLFCTLCHEVDEFEEQVREISPENATDDQIASLVLELIKLQSVSEVEDRWFNELTKEFWSTCESCGGTGEYRGLEVAEDCEECDGVGKDPSFDHTAHLDAAYCYRETHWVKGEDFYPRDQFERKYSEKFEEVTANKSRDIGFECYTNKVICSGRDGTTRVWDHEDLGEDDGN